MDEGTDYLLRVIWRRAIEYHDFHASRQLPHDSFEGRPDEFRTFISRYTNRKRWGGRRWLVRGAKAQGCASKSDCQNYTERPIIIAKLEE